MEADSGVSNDSVESFGVTCSSNTGCNGAIDGCEDVRIDATDPKKKFINFSTRMQISKSN
jgi:hypothetical protein